MKRAEQWSLLQLAHSNATNLQVHIYFMSNWLISVQILSASCHPMEDCYHLKLFELNCSIDLTKQRSFCNFGETSMAFNSFEFVCCPFIANSRFLEDSKPLDLS